MVGLTGCGSCGKGSEPENAPPPSPPSSAGTVGQKLLRQTTTEQGGTSPIQRLTGSVDAGTAP